MPITQNEFETLISDTTKTIIGDITWDLDEDHSPAVEFKVDVISETGYPIFVRGSFNTALNTLSYVLIHRAIGRIYGLDLGKDHHNVSCQYVGEKHKHRWKDELRDKDAYVPEHITADASDAVAVWQQFCDEARITHSGQMRKPPPLQLELL